jgi:hypothetical protein
MAVVVATAHGTPAIGGLLDMFWSNRRDDAFDQACPGD